MVNEMGRLAEGGNGGSLRKGGGAEGRRSGREEGPLQLQQGRHLVDGSGEGNVQARPREAGLDMGGELSRKRRGGVDGPAHPQAPVLVDQVAHLHSDLPVRTRTTSRSLPSFACHTDPPRRPVKETRTKGSTATATALD